MNDYSQNGESKIAAEFLPSIGQYLSFGENDGITLSNVYGFYEMGWRGYNVEPSKEAFSRLVKNQPESININAAVALDSGYITLHESGEHLGKGDVSLLSTLLAEEKTRWIRESFNEVTVSGLTPEEIINMSGTDIDLLSIDIEGYEIKVLPRIMSMIKPSVAIVEWNGKFGDEFRSIMSGYYVAYSNAENLIFVKQ